MPPHVTDIRTIDYASLTIEQEPYAAPGKKGYKKCAIRLSGQPLTVQTPRMRLPFHYREEDTSATGALLPSAYSTQFQAFLVKLDEMIIAAAVASTSTWFGKSIPRDTVVGMYKGPYRPPEKYAASFKMKFLKNEDGSKTFDVFERGSEIRAIVECTGVWIVNTNIGYNWRIKQLIVQPPPNKDYAFVDDLDDGAEVAPEEAK
jgi:hypothetical protein